MKVHRISKNSLKKIHSGSEKIPVLYFHHNPIARHVFYQRLEKILELATENYRSYDKKVCDFGGGGGVFLPTLSENFNKVFIMDLETTEAEKLVKKYHLKNVFISKGNALYNNFPENYFDIIIAADVLEHFKKPGKAIKEIYRLLNHDGVLIVSVPTENFLYRIGRLIIGLKKPKDHYHNAKEIENLLIKGFFTVTKKRFLPFYFSFLSLFNILKLKKMDREDE